MTITRDLIATAFPGQPRMQAAFEALVNDAETATDNLNTALAAISGLSGGADAILAALAGKQPKNDTLDAISILGPDPGVLEQIQAGIFAVRPIDAADTSSLITRALADTRYLGGAHAAASATKLATARTITITGDGTWSVTFDGSTNVSAALTIPVFTSTVKGTAPASGGGTTNFLRADGTWAAPGSGVTPAALTKTDDTNVTLTLGGTPASALLQGVSVTVGWTGQLAVGRGGTGIASYAVGDLIYASAATTLSKLADVATGNVLISGGVGVAPAWGKVGISTHVSGLGTGVATALAVNVGSAGALVTFNGALGTPSSGTLTNCTFASPSATALTLLNSVTNVGGAYATAAYRKYADNRIAVEGWLQGGGGTSPVNIATLPAGARPLANQTFPCVNFAAGAPFAGMFEVQSTGGVFWYSSNTSAAFSISGINFQT